MDNLFSVSNIAWDRHDDPAVFRLLSKYGVNGIEIAPSKIWNDLRTVSPDDAKEYRSLLADHGFSVPAFQAILYGCPQLQVFDPETHEAFLERIRLIAEIASHLGAKVLVFGAPKNRRRNGLEYYDAFDRACGFFRKAGAIAADYGCALGIEANPVEYQCDFLTCTADAERFVMAVDSPGVVLHIDSGATAMTHERIEDVLTTRQIAFAHYHISEPMLDNAETSRKVDHLAAFRALKQIHYRGAVSIEMKSQPPEFENLKRALQYITGIMKDADF